MKPATASDTTAAATDANAEAKIAEVPPVQPVVIDDQQPAVAEKPPAATADRATAEAKPEVVAEEKPVEVAAETKPVDPVADKPVERSISVDETPVDDAAATVL